MSVLNEWIESAGRVSLEDMRNAYDVYLQDCGLDRMSVDYFKPNHPSMGDIFVARNWVRLLPNGTVIRLQNTDDVYSELIEIVSETYRIMEASGTGNLVPSENDTKHLPKTVEDVKYEVGHRAFLCKIIVEILGGDADVNKIRKGSTGAPSEARTQPPDHAITVLVEFRNERNMLDIAVVEVDNPAEFFGTRYGSSTLMLEAMAQRELAPKTVINDVAFELEGTGWAKSEPPEHPISYQSTDQRNRSQFFRIDDPKEYYGHTWGNIDEMIKIENSDEFVEQREFLHDAGVINWRISLAI